ncbi:MAG: phosphohistidine phosphatase SixA [Bacteroidota bacterium]
MHLYFLRHGDAVESPYYHDTQRPLSDLGKRQLQGVLHFLRSTKTPVELILTSPLVRGKETAEIIRAGLQTSSLLTTEALAPGGNFRDLLAAINIQQAKSMMLVGHEPQLSSAISVLTGDDEHFRLEMKKASLALVETPFPVKKGHAVLSWLLTAAQMESIR